MKKKNEKITQWKDLLISIFTKLRDESVWNDTISMFYFKSHFKFTKEEYEALEDIINEVLNENETTLEKDETVILVGKLRKIHRDCICLSRFNEYLYDDVLTLSVYDRLTIDIIIHSFLEKL